MTTDRVRCWCPPTIVYTRSGRAERVKHGFTCPNGPPRTEEELAAYRERKARAAREVDERRREAEAEQRRVRLSHGDPDPPPGLRCEDGYHWWDTRYVRARRQTTCRRCGASA